VIASRDNPYRVQRVEEVLRFDPELIGSSWEELIGRFEDANWWGAVVGAKGSGKTTFFEQLVHEAQNAGFTLEHVGLEEGDPLERVEQLHKELPVPTALVVDSAGVLAWRDQRKLLKMGKSRRLIVSLHKESRRWPTLLSLSSTPDILIALNKKLGEPITLNHQEAENLLTQHKYNLRDCFWDLFDQLREA